MSDRKPTNPSLRIIHHQSVPPATLPQDREPTNAELAQQMISLGSSFDEHRDEDRKGFEELKNKTNWQTFWIAVFTAVAAIIGALAR